MIKSKNEIKPFYVYTNKNKLYIKNINEKTEKLASNISSYCANIDSSKKIHICALDTSGKLIHFSNNSRGTWKKHIIGKTFNNINKVKEMRLFILDNYLNIFSVEESSLDDNLYRVTHFNFSTLNYKVSRFNINNIVKDKEQIYKVSIDNLSNIVFEYKPSQFSSRDTLESTTLIFNSKSRTWITPNTLLRCKNNYNECNTTIKDDIFDYCYGITYKL